MRFQLNEDFESHQTKSFLLINEAVKTTINDHLGGGVYGKGQLGVSFLRISMWAGVREGRLDGYFVEKGLPVGI